MNFVPPSEKIEQAVHELFVQKKLTLALAESCTGGKVAASLTALPGASDYFLGSAVVYSNRLKQRLLAVREEALQQYGAVSKEVALEMLSGLLLKTDADWGVAITGIAGPSGGTEEKPVGTVWIAVGERGKQPDVDCFISKGNREENILCATHWALELLLRKVLYGEFGL